MNTSGGAVHQSIINNKKVLATHCHHMLVGEQLPTEGSIWKAQVCGWHAYASRITPPGKTHAESLEFKTNELSVDEATARAAKCTDSVSGTFVAVLIQRRRQKAIQDEVLWCQMLSATFEYEAKWQLMALDQNTWAEKETLSMDYIS